MHFLVFLGLPVAVIVIYYALLRARAEPRRQVYTIHCRHCGQKLRYGEDKVGYALPCPRCLRTCTLVRSHVHS
jgi:hypothetical protein